MSLELVDYKIQCHGSHTRPSLTLERMPVLELAPAEQEQLNKWHNNTLQRYRLQHRYLRGAWFWHAAVVCDSGNIEFETRTSYPIIAVAVCFGLYGSAPVRFGSLPPQST